MKVMRKNPSKPKKNIKI